MLKWNWGSLSKILPSCLQLQLTDLSRRERVEGTPHLNILGKTQVEESQPFAQGPEEKKTQGLGLLVWWALSSLALTGWKHLRGIKSPAEPLCIPACSTRAHLEPWQAALLITSHHNPPTSRLPVGPLWASVARRCWDGKLCNHFLHFQEEPVGPLGRPPQTYICPLFFNTSYTSTS